MDNTYTYVSYFTKEDVRPIMEELAKLEEEYAKRRDHLHPKAELACDRRLDIVKNGIKLLIEPVPQPYGG